MENEKPCCDVLSEKKFITSPADVDTHRQVKLQDAEVLDKYIQKNLKNYVKNIMIYSQRILQT